MKEYRYILIEQFDKCERVLGRKRSTELRRHVYLPSSRQTVQPETKCCRVSAFKQKEHADD